MALTMYTEGDENMTGQINTGNIQGLLSNKKRKQQQQQNPFLVQEISDSQIFASSGRVFWPIPLHACIIMYFFHYT